MRRLKKTVDKTWRGIVDNEIKDSNLDNVYATKNLQFEKIYKNGVEAKVDVIGWVDETTDIAKDTWNELYSDHSLLNFTVLKVQSIYVPTF